MRKKKIRFKPIQISPVHNCDFLHAGGPSLQAGMVWYVDQRPLSNRVPNHRPLTSPRVSVGTAWEKTDAALSLPGCSDGGGSRFSHALNTGLSFRPSYVSLHIMNKTYHEEAGNTSIPGNNLSGSAYFALHELHFPEVLGSCWKVQRNHQS